MTTINETKLRKLCDNLYEDRESILLMCPGMGQSEAVLWILYGSLLSLLDIPSDQSPDIHGDTPTDKYFQANCCLLRDRVDPPFNFADLIRRLLGKLD